MPSRMVLASSGANVVHAVEVISTIAGIGTGGWIMIQAKEKYFLYCSCLSIKNP
jgi:hypothetical protein